MNLSVHGYETQREQIRASLERYDLTFAETDWGFEIYGITKASIPIRLARQASETADKRARTFPTALFLHTPDLPSESH